jgi:hypothetical protein
VVGVVYLVGVFQRTKTADVAANADAGRDDVLAGGVGVAGDLAHVQIGDVAVRGLHNMSTLMFATRYHQQHTNDKVTSDKTLSA